MMRNPVVQFLALGVVLLLAILWGTSTLSERTARAEALTDACTTTWLLGHSVAQPAVTAGLVAGEPSAVATFGQTVQDRLLVGAVRRVKVWSPNGTVLWSDEPRLIGDRFDLGAAERRVLDHGGSDAEVSDLSEPENRFERSGDGLVEVYTRIVSPQGTPLLFEAYYPTSSIEERKQQVFAPFQRITVGSLLLLVLVATPMLMLMKRRLTRAAEERQHLLESAVDASAAERRRIARDLHDGVVQDLAGTAFSVSALARDEPDVVRRATLDRASASLRDGLRSLRSLLVEIHPPDLRASGLRAALEDLTAPASGAGVVTTVHVEGVDAVPAQTVALVWRVAQEAVRNATRHAHASRLDVSVRGEGGRVTLTVGDDGVGFSPEETPETSFGLRGLSSLVEDHGGRIEVRSIPGGGTTLSMEVGAGLRRRLGRKVDVS